MATPHNRGEKGDFAKRVLMPGDPLRAKFIAETYLEEARLVTDVRNVYGYTGYYGGKKISVMAAGMGMPSMGIYSYELFHDYDVEEIIRIGSCGSIHPDVRLMDVVIAEGACTDSNWQEQYGLRGHFAPVADFTLLRSCVEASEKLGASVRVGNILTQDAFYDDDPNVIPSWGKMGVLAVEMEAAGLYMNAARLGRRALALMTVSDELLTGKHLTVEERTTSFREMMEIALNME